MDSTALETPVTASVVSIRLIRSFYHRNIRNLVLRDVDLSLRTSEFQLLVAEKAKSASNLPPPFKTFGYDCFKIEHQAHGAKTSDPVINRDDDEKLILKSDMTLAEAGVKNETEISFFKLADYETYKADPEVDLAKTN